MGSNTYTDCSGEVVTLTQPADKLKIRPHTHSKQPHAITRMVPAACLALVNGAAGWAASQTDSPTRALQTQKTMPDWHVPAPTLYSSSRAMQVNDAIDKVAAAAAAITIIAAATTTAAAAATSAADDDNEGDGISGEDDGAPPLPLIVARPPPRALEEKHGWKIGNLQASRPRNLFVKQAYSSGALLEEGFRKAKEKHKQLLLGRQTRFTRTAASTASSNNTIVPINLELEHGGIYYQDAFSFNADEAESVQPFALQLCQDESLPAFMVDVIGADIGRQIKEFIQLAQVDLGNRVARIQLELRDGATVLPTLFFGRTQSLQLQLLLLRRRLRQSWGWAEHGRLRLSRPYTRSSWLTASLPCTDTVTA